MLKGSLKLIKDAKERGNKAVVGISQEKEKEENEDVVQKEAHSSIQPRVVWFSRDS